MGEEEEQQHLSNSPNPDTEITENPSHQQQEEEYSSWPAIRFDVPPQRTYHFSQQFRTPSKPNNFLKAVKWSPDGSCFLTSSEDNTLRVFAIPESGNEYVNGYSAPSDEDSYAASLVINEGESVYDYCWYPYMSASDPVTCVFASTARDHPIHLWDASSGQLRCTYRAYDAVDEITAAFSIAFNPSGTKIFAGYNKLVRVFDLHRPGRDYNQYSTVQGNKEGQTGIMSAMAFSPTHNGMLAIGSYSKTTAIYREDNMELLYVLHGHEGGITHVQFSKDGNYLYTGGRKDGFVHIYDLQTGQWVSGFQAALDTVNGFSFHPFLPMATTSSGHRRFLPPDDGIDELHLSGHENCASVWSFSVASMEENVVEINGDDHNSQNRLQNL
ncbi:uncharacterized protein LOC133733438 isoform X2 [Rosa rugosa]|uniref:uncharacterized protein LOC133733438 isoform X2 n=1 Tax=Rosa rugosa TaxID=74645 RepID=UPI002B404350|nr:uncharacterized protein LOC133733438 isoform X2 [Rosa rugosa]